MQTQKQLEARMNMERRMVRRLIRTAKAHGFAVVKVDDVMAEMNEYSDKLCLEVA